MANLTPIRTETLSPHPYPDFQADISGPLNAQNALLMVHGFGVRNDSRGMFTELAEITDSWAMSIRGNMADPIDGHTTQAVPFAEQSARVEAMLNYADKDGLAQLAVVCHSLGCLSVARSRGVVASQVYLLAPPMGNAFETFIQTPGWQRPGSKLNLAGESTLERKDGSITKVAKEFWDEFEKFGKVERFYAGLGKENKVTVIFAEEDQVWGEQTAPRGIRTETIEGADHDFRGTARKKLFNFLLQDIKRWV
ncbi:MAG TPA: alpha/beta hydrolase [Patescibacteria group bacterium]|nr:alpha/beta hydrolase [Patescibacteria group bacterium]